MDIRDTLALSGLCPVAPCPPNLQRQRPKPAPPRPFRRRSRALPLTLAEGEAQARAAMTSGADPHALITPALAQTELAVETAVTVRDRVVEAYQEILRMPV